MYSQKNTQSILLDLCILAYAILIIVDVEVDIVMNVVSLRMIIYIARNILEYIGNDIESALWQYYFTCKSLSI